MRTRKWNEYLDTGGSDGEDGSGYDSEAAQESKGGRTIAPPSHGSKRRRRNASDSDSASDEGIEDLGADSIQKSSTAEARQTSPSRKDPPTSPAKSLVSKPVSSAKDRPHKRGVVYLSRIPPFMRPSTVRHLLSTHGTITRLFLTPEPPASYISRKKSGGNKKRSFIDGWIEFSRRKDAKICVEAINGQIVGGKKGGWYRDDVWNAKYLKGFGWEDLMESVRREEREREEKIRVGLSREGKERKEFLRGVEMSKVEEGKRRKREAKEARKVGQGAESQVELEKAEVKALPKQRFEQRFKQNEISGKNGKEAAQSDDVKRVLSKIF